MKKLIAFLILALLMFNPNFAFAESSRLAAAIEAFAEAIEEGKSIDPELIAKEFGYKNFTELVEDYKKVYESEITVEDAREFIKGTDTSINIVESQENLDKLYSLIMNDKVFLKYQKKKDSYFNLNKSNKALAVYINYDKEMAKITQNPNLKKISTFPWDYGWGTTAQLRDYYAIEYCRKDAAKFKAFGGECIIIDINGRNALLNPSYKPKLKEREKKTIVKKKEEKKIEEVKKKKEYITKKKKKPEDKKKKEYITKKKKKPEDKKKKEYITKKKKEPTVKKKESKKVKWKEKMVIPVSVKLVQINKGEFKSSMTEKDVMNHFKKANKIWESANIFLNVIEVKKVPGNLKGFEKAVAYMDKNFNNFAALKKEISLQLSNSKVKRGQQRLDILHKLTQARKNQNKKAINVYFIPKLLFKAACGLTKVYYRAGYGGHDGILLKKLNKGYIVVAEQLPHGCTIEKTIAHEIGHALTLDHQGENNNLMMYGKGTFISDTQTSYARMFYTTRLSEVLN